MDAASNNPKRKDDGLKTRERRLAIFLWAVSIGSVCASVYLCVAVHNLFPDRWDNPNVREIVIEMLVAAAIFFIGGFTFWRFGLGWWRFAHAGKQTVADTAKTKAG